MFTGRVILGSLGALLPAAVAAAQQTVPSPPVDKNQAISPLMGYAIIFILLVFVLGVSLMPSKRSHLD